MRSLLACALLVGFVGLAGGASALEPGSPEDVLMRYLRALKDNKPGDAYDLVSKAMRQGKDKEVWIKEQQALMAMADVKIFDFTVYPGKVAGEKAQVPNVLESQDKFVNTLGLTEHELYTLVREDGGWKIDSQILLEQAEIPKWFPAKKKDDAKAPPSH
jgi:hypothetical protein